MHKILVGLLVLTGVGFLVVPLWFESLVSEACVELDEDIFVCAASEMAKLPNHGRVPLEHDNFAIHKKPLKLNAARNSTIAFQLILQSRADDISDAVSFSLSTLRSKINHINTEDNARFFQAWYTHVDKGGYEWGPDSDVLPWPDDYPDALVPEFSECTISNEPIYKSVALPKTKAGLQSVWVDLYIPKEQTAGLYKGVVSAKLESGKQIEIPLELTVWSATLPDKNSIDAVGEVYRSYRMEGAGEDMQSPQWQAMSHCYQKMAHKHRLVFIERLNDLDTQQKSDAYDRIYDPILSGSLFTAENNYIGPGQNTPVSIWRTPWPQDYDIRLENPLSRDEVSGYQEASARWQKRVKKNQWDQTQFYAYIFDEVDGPDRNIIDRARRQEYLKMVHSQMHKVQRALDFGAGEELIDLIWTSHSNPLRWAGVEDVDLSDIVRLWAPNAGAASPEYLYSQKLKGDKIWFYHNGHPALGVHSINASGIEMRTWGVIGARYGFDGQLMWAVNLGSDEEPFARPSYKDDDDRFGNGVMVYPGNQLDKIGFKKTPGPLPSMRLKAWRRGLQDAELVQIALNEHEKIDEMSELLTEIVPTALADAIDLSSPSWSSDPKVWIDFHTQLLKLASGQ